MRIDPEVWAQLAGFVERREAIRAEYQTFTGHLSEYTLQPYHLLAYHGNWYVFARNMAKNRVATFAISRFRRIEPTGCSFPSAAHVLEENVRKDRSVKRIAFTPRIEEQIIVSPRPHAEYNPLGLVPILRGRTRTLPAGSVVADGLSLAIDPGSSLNSVDALRQTAIPLPSGRGEPLSALATVELVRSEPTRELVRFDGEEAIIVGVVPKEKIDIIDFGDRIAEIVEQTRPQVAPVELEIMTFQPERVDTRLSGLQLSLLQGVLIVAAVVILTMGPRMGLTVAIMVPVVALSSLAIYTLAGGVLHQISIAALVLSLGLLVDNAIVVAERMQFRIDQGLPRGEAAGIVIRELFWPLAAATGTTLAAFLPLLLSRGVTADFTRALPHVVMLTITVSFVFALSVTPTLGILFFRAAKRREKWQSRMLEPVLNVVSQVSVRRPGIVILATIVVVIGLVALAPLVEQQFFPATDRNQLVLGFELPEATHVNETSRAVIMVEGELRSDPRVQHVAAFIGRSAPRFYYNLLESSRSPHRGQLLVTTENRDQVPEVISWARTFVRDELPEVVFVARAIEQGPPVTAPVEVRLYGDEYVSLENAIAYVTDVTKNARGAVDVRPTLPPVVPTYRLRVDDTAAAHVGLSRSDVAVAVLGHTRGIDAGSLQVGGASVPIVVRTGTGGDVSPEELGSIQLWSATGERVSLASLAQTEIELRPAASYRQDGQRVASVLAELEPGVTDADVLKQIMPHLEGAAELADVNNEIGGAAEGSGEANSAILAAAYIGVAVLLFVLLAQFRSFVKVGIVLLTVPLAAAGAVPGLLIMNQPFGFVAMLGIIALVGIVVNNAIILVDLIDVKRGLGQAIADAIAESVSERFRPIVLTALTTIAGLTPLLYTTSTLWPPFASAVISGLAVSTGLTIFAVPAVYFLAFRRSEGRATGRAQRVAEQS